MYTLFEKESDRRVESESTYTYFRFFAKEFTSEEEAIEFRDANGFPCTYIPVKD